MARVARSAAKASVPRGPADVVDDEVPGAAQLATLDPAMAIVPGPSAVVLPGGEVVLDAATLGRATLRPRGRGRAVLTLDATARAGAHPVETPAMALVLPSDGQGDTGAVHVREVVIDGWRFLVQVESARRAALRGRATRDRPDAGHGGPAEVRAIIPGRVVSVAVAAGETVGEGGQLLVVEAMKMQNELRAPRAGTIARVAVAPGQTIDVGDVLVVIE